MHLILNGDRIEHHGPCSLESLLKEKNVKAERVATVVNDDIVPLKMRAKRQLLDGDRVEIITFAGGG